MSGAGSSEGTLAAMLAGQAITRGDAPAILAPGRAALSYAELWHQVGAVSHALRSRGATRATRVAVVLPPGPEMATVFLGVAAACVCAPLNPLCPGAELRVHLADLGVRIVVVRRGETGPVVAVAKELGLALLEVGIDSALPAGSLHLAQSEISAPSLATYSEPEEVALILHTSGTTARPKIVPLTQSNLVASARGIARQLALQPTDRCLNVMPLFHIHGLVGALLATLAGGASIVCTHGFEAPAFFDWIAHFEPSWYTAVPTIHHAVVAHGDLYRQKAPTHRFRFVRSSSAALAPRLFDQLQALTGAPVIEAYGMTEASHQMTSNPLPPASRKAGSVGVGAGVEVALMDAGGRLLTAYADADAVGEIVVRGPGVTRGYENNPQANASSFVDGWFRTGDQGRFDADGYLFIAGRLKEIISRGGEKISPREIDEALLAHPDVAQAVAFALPHPTLGEDLAAAVVLNSGATTDESALRHFLFRSIADFKVPSVIVFVDAIPTGATGKVQRTRLHQMLGARMECAFVAPRSDIERSVHHIVREVLGCEALGIHDNFFAAGGDSLRGARVIARLNQRHGLSLPVTALFRHPSIESLAREAEAAQAARSMSIDDELAAEIALLSDEEVARLLADEQPSV